MLLATNYCCTAAVTMHQVHALLKAQILQKYLERTDQEKSSFLRICVHLPHFEVLHIFIALRLGLTPCDVITSPTQVFQLIFTKHTLFKIKSQVNFFQAVQCLCNRLLCSSLVDPHTSISSIYTVTPSKHSMSCVIFL